MESRLILEVDSVLRSAQPRTWDLAWQCSTTTATWTAELVDPLTASARNELSWYLEQYVLEDTLSETRRTNAVWTLEKCRSILSQCVQEALLAIHPPASGSSNFQVELRISGDGTLQSLHSLPWELLEGVQTEGARNAFRCIAVLRISRHATVETVHHSLAGPGRPIRILFCSARPGGPADISYRAISNKVWALLSAESAASKQVELRFARPGTWRAFQRALRQVHSRPFDIVHLDVHGSIRHRAGHSRYASLEIYLTLTQRQRRPAFRLQRPYGNKSRLQGCYRHRERVAQIWSQSSRPKRLPVCEDR